MPLVGDTLSPRITGRPREVDDVLGPASLRLAPLSRSRESAV